MEKCTFCVHRIRDSKFQARLQNKELKDGDIKTACEQSCPTDAIVFGNYNNKESRVRKGFEDPRGYAVLEEFFAKPSIRYLSKVRNTDETINNGKSEGGHA